MNNVPYYSAEDLKELEAQRDKLSLCLNVMTTEEIGLSLDDAREIVKIFERLPLHQSKVLVETLDLARLRMAVLHEEILSRPWMRTGDPD